MKIKEFVLYLFNRIPIFKWRVTESYVNLNKEEEATDVNKILEEQVLELMKSTNPFMYEEYMNQKMIDEVNNGTIMKVGE